MFMRMSERGEKKREEARKSGAWGRRKSVAAEGVRERERN